MDSPRASVEPRAAQKRKKAGAAAAAQHGGPTPLSIIGSRVTDVRCDPDDVGHAASSTYGNRAGFQRSHAALPWLQWHAHCSGCARKPLAACGGWCYSELHSPMTVPSSASSGGCSSAVALAARDARADDARSSKEQVEFGIKVAQNGLWKEARIAGRRPSRLDPTYARGVEQPRDRLRAAGQVREGARRRTRRRSSSTRRTC